MTKPPLARRLLLLAAIPTAASAQKGGTGVTDADSGDSPGRGRSGSRPIQRQPTSDSDPRDRAGQGRPQTGTSDSDPNDAGGRGRPRTGQSDSDPRDGAGRGQPRTGNSDSDPSDGAGRGRPSTGVSDSDPRDAAGRGGYRYR